VVFYYLKMPIQIQSTKDASHTLYVPELDETYHSRNGAIGEAEYVYIGRGLEDFVRKSSAKNIAILEIGFGTGLNAFLSLLKSSELTIECYYHAIETNPLSVEITQQLNYANNESKNLFDQMHHCTWEQDEKMSAHFTLRKQNVSVQQFQSLQLYDIIYFDAFAPEKQPDMWQKSVFEKLYSLLKQGGLMVTYSSKGDVKRLWKEIGFEVERLPGPPMKRHMLRAIKPVTK
jgi:tRNA U34 5-methylaminomethyl-2-thiouridine-forming methyltransferase MnmC